MFKMSNTYQYLFFIIKLRGFIFLIIPLQKCTGVDQSGKLPPGGTEHVVVIGPVSRKPGAHV